MDQYIRDVSAVVWIHVCNESNDFHEEAVNCISILKQYADKYAPIKQASQSKRRQLATSQVSWSRGKMKAKIVLLEL